jgi:hypothetical protein
MIAWPCILKLEGDDELLFLGTKQDFITECQTLILTDSDYVLDSNGISYLIDIKQDKPVLVQTEKVLTVEDVTQLIRTNEFVKAEVCLTKIYFPTISDAINSLHY